MIDANIPRPSVLRHSLRDALEAKIKPRSGNRNDTFVTVGLTVVIMIIWFLLSIVMHSEGNAIYYVLAGMAVVGVGWWFWRKGKRLK